MIPIGHLLADGGGEDASLGANAANARNEPNFPNAAPSTIDREALKADAGGIDDGPEMTSNDRQSAAVAAGIPLILCYCAVLAALEIWIQKQS